MVMNMDLLIITYRTILFYFIIIIAYRLMGKREVGQLGVIDLIVSILIAELVAISIENYNGSLLLAIIPIITLVTLEILLAYLSIKSRKINSILSGRSTPIILNGKLNYKEMLKQRYSLDDLLLQLRLSEIKSLSDVEYAFLESNGKLSIFKYNKLHNKSDYPMPLIIDGIIQETSLKHINKNKSWLLKELDNNNLLLNNVFYAFYKRKKIYIINNKDIY